MSQLFACVFGWLTFNRCLDSSDTKKSIKTAPRGQDVLSEGIGPRGKGVDVVTDFKGLKLDLDY